MPTDPARKKIERDADEAVDEFLKGYIARTPGAEGLGATAQVRVYKKRPKGFSREPITVVDGLIASKAYRGWSNARIAASIQASSNCSVGPTRASSCRW